MPVWWQRTIRAQLLSGFDGLSELVGHRVHGRRYADQMPFEHITVDPGVMSGVPCVRGTRIPVATVVGMVADGMAHSEILANFPQLTEASVQDALRFAAARVAEREIELPRGA